MGRSRQQVLGSALLVGAIGLAGLAVVQQPAQAASTATIDAGTVLQPIDGFGFSQAFGRAKTIRQMSSVNQQKVLDLLLSPTTGAGLSILRLGINTESHLIQATDPGGPNAAPKYSWDGSDGGQVWLAQKAKAYGVKRFYANAWSAPAYMKTNNSLINGGVVCGLAGATCANGDWTKAYANYLVQYAKYYAQEGIGVTDLGFTNEPNWTTNYASMRMTPAQVAQMAAIAGPIVTKGGYRLACCDAVNWNSERSYSNAVLADDAAKRYVTLHTGHSYGNYPTTPLASGGNRTWMSEWSPDGKAWDEAWDDGTDMSGLSVAQRIHDAMTGGQVNGYVYWYGVSTGATRGFVQGDGANFKVSKRLWSMASFSRYVRPGANRIGATTSGAGMKLSAYRNTDGSIVVVALNTGTSNESVRFSLRNAGVTSGSAMPYLTNQANDMSAQPSVPVSGGAFDATVPARSLITYRITGNASAANPSTTTANPSTTTAASPALSQPTSDKGTNGTLVSSFRWSSSNALISPKPDASHNPAGVKDPSVVYHGGKWHVFSSVASANGYNLEYRSFTDWSQASAATPYYLDKSGIGKGYRAAPEVFYFAPQKLWYLVYQTGNASYSTNPDISSPAGWSAPKHFYSGMPSIITQNIGNGHWVDMWVICDDTNCHLFSSDDNGHLYRSQTSLANFPNGMSQPVIALQDSNKHNLFEAGNVYKVAGGNQYLLIVEAIGREGRYFRSWTSDSPAGSWTPLAATKNDPFASEANVTFTGDAWTRDFSHGELIRSRNDQTLTISPCKMQYLYQGMAPGSGGNYNALPWRLGLLTQTNSTC